MADNNIEEMNPFDEEFDDNNSFDEEIEDINPFGEEFEDDAVINRGDAEIIDASKKDKEVKGEIIPSEEFERRSDPEFSLKNFSDEDIDQIISYDNERRKKLTFREEIDKVEINKKLDVPEEGFKDYLVAPSISGKRKYNDNPNLIEAKTAKDGGYKVEISDDPHLFDEGHEKATVMINRDEKGDVDNIEIKCKCGERILLKFEFAENFDDELTHVKIDKVGRPRPFTTEEILEEPEEMNYPELLQNDEDIVRDLDDDEDDFSKIKKPKLASEESGIKTPDLEESADEQFGLGEFLQDDELDTGEIDLGDI